MDAAYSQYDTIFGMVFHVERSLGFQDPSNVI
jgi:hypothetical protein